jgi:hypothetical protein
MKKIESEVPFGHMLYTLLYLKNLQLDELTPHGRLETHYLAWESVRKELNPYFQNGTGFEGYLTGRCPNPESALEAILAINQNILDAIARLYRFKYGLRSRLMKTLVNEASDPEAIHIWSAYLGAELGKLRAQIIRNPEAQKFRTQTYSIVKHLPLMVYHEMAEEEDVAQTYAVGATNNTPAGRMFFTSHMLKPRQQDAWLVAENIGEFGHPLVRKLLDHALS